MSDIIRQGWLQKLFFYLTNKSLVKKQAYSASAKESVKKHTTCEAKPTVSNQKKSWLNVDIPFWLLWCMGVQSDIYIFSKKNTKPVFLFGHNKDCCYLSIFIIRSLVNIILTYATKDIIDYIVKLVYVISTTSTTMSVSLTCTVD